MKIKIETTDGISWSQVSSGPEGLASAKNTRSIHGFTSADVQDLSNLEYIDSVSFGVARNRSVQPQTSSITRQSASIKLATDGNERVVALIEDGEFFRWVPAARGQDSITDAIIALNFDSEISGAAANRQRSVFRPNVIVHLFRYVVEQALKHIGRYIDGKGPFGLFRLTSKNPETWHPSERENFDDDAEPTRILLLVHGTFSTTEGSFGPLARDTLVHRAFIDKAFEHYDDVLAFDHKTLGKSVSENTRDLTKALSRYNSNKNKITIDAISYSRGGLVLRDLFENHFADLAGFEPGKIIHVGAPMAGTNLANPENWKALLALYTHVIASATGAYGGTTGAQYVGAPVVAIVKALGNFAQLVVETGVRGDELPGLQSLDPDGNFIAEIQKSNSKAIEHYHIIGSDYEVDVAYGSENLETLQLEAADVVLDELFDDKNDLIVQTKSMGKMNAVTTLKPCLGFSPDEGVYHTVYFEQEKTIIEMASILFDEDISHFASEPHYSDSGVDPKTYVSQKSKNIVTRDNGILPFESQT